MKVEISVNTGDPQEVALVVQFMQALSDGRNGANSEAGCAAPKKTAAKAKAARTQAAKTKAAKAQADQIAKATADKEAQAKEAEAEEFDTVHSLEDLREKLTSTIKSDKALRGTIKAKLTDLGVANVTTLPKEHYDSFYDFLDGLIDG